MSKTITVFGSSKPVPGEMQYQFAFDLGLSLASKGYDIANGGYSGTMAAVSQGASQFPVNIIGVTCSAFGRNGPNKWITKEILTSDLHNRLSELVAIGDGYIALLGGTGTLLEISMVWELLNKQFLPVKPLVLVGPAWHNVVKEVVNHDSDANSLVYCVDAIEDAITLIEKNI